MIREATLEEIPWVITTMQVFRDTTKFVPVDVDVCIATYTSLVAKGVAHMLIMIVEDKLIGCLAFIVAPDLHSGTLTAVETFWLVLPEERGSGLRLLHHYEKLAASLGCRKIAMIHLEDSYPDQLEKLYTRRGYTLTEKHYVKEVEG